MASPVVQPIRPEDSASFVKSVHGEYHIVLDDVDSSISLSDTFVTGFYGKQKRSVISTVESLIRANFNDTGPNPIQPSFVDLSMGTDIVLSVPVTNGEFNNAVFFKDKPSSILGCAFEFKLDFISHSIVGSTHTPREYYGSTDFTGVSAGICDFRSKSAIVLFFNQNQEIFIAGPSQDGVGTRVGFTASYDWETANDSAIYSIFMDYKRDKVVVSVATVEEGPDTVLLDTTLSSMGLFLPTVGLANVFHDSDDSLLVFVAQDGRELGDTVAIKDFCIYPDSYPYVYKGVYTKFASGIISSRDSHTTSIDFSDWVDTNVFLYESPPHRGLEFSTLQGSLTATYQDLQTNKFVLSLNTYAKNFRLNKIYTGLGIKISNIHIKFLDQKIGIVTDFTDLTNINNYTTYDLNIERNTHLVIACDGTDVTILCKKENAFGSYFIPVLTESVANLPGSPDTEISFTSDSNYEGTLFIKDFSFCPTANLAISSHYPNGYSPSMTSLINAGSLEFTQPLPSFTGSTSLGGGGVSYTGDHSQISGQYVTIPKYSPRESGITCIIKSVIHFPNGLPQPKTEVGPFIIMSSGSPTTSNVVEKGVHLYFVRGTNGSLYGYFPGDDQDYLEVAAQTNKGKTISFAVPNIPSTEAVKTGHILIDWVIRYSPEVGLTVFDCTNDMLPLIRIPYGIIGGSERILPNVNGEGVLLPLDVANDLHFTGAVGVLDLSNIKARHIVGLCAFGIGRGFDLFMFKNTDLMTPALLYGSESRILVHTEDND